MSVGVVIVVVAVLLGAVVLFWVLQKGGNGLRRHGASGVAVILSVQQTSGREGGMPVSNITLEVTPQEGPGFQVVAKQAISPANSYLFQPGKQVPVRYDRANRSNIIIITDA